MISIYIEYVAIGKRHVLVSILINVSCL